MEAFNHNLASLFSQLGLDNSTDFIEHFLQTHSLTQPQKLAEAPFFTVAQQQFINEAQQQDADWCEVIDQLDVLLRK
ncbi:hypothetical protein UB37_11240 [Photobacterium iliopiscarium]|jgi:hypothetical protein|uniref:DUF2789 domain-containing protein n=1 Tax=Photobacterium iliopiscarium TaxID=56192 RepID=A0A0D8P506_9GAMM|nr:DUF2789 family protein [Photobacterium iliopiscarium]KJG12977.1 hypothetical protein UB38_12255 [Photobacterium iliopiscarium]KJG21434.1 hypothetical protein UB37_11240 [Photobacterium iliopiscarium]MCD9467614.1 DUF2789 domain-containing protein [Photobacterium iliopiscarium]MCD9487320.1 DUF2789 family protein [Photobacterium iliopiscarium]MCF2244040.1 DUF2789 family protein [Photobacterium iliopiscarium]